MEVDALRARLVESRSGLQNGRQQAEGVVWRERRDVGYRQRQVRDVTVDVWELEGLNLLVGEQKRRRYAPAERWPASGRRQPGPGERRATGCGVPNTGQLLPERRRQPRRGLAFCPSVGRIPSFVQFFPPLFFLRRLGSTCNAQVRYRGTNRQRRERPMFCGGLASRGSGLWCPAGLGALR